MQWVRDLQRQPPTLWNESRRVIRHQLIEVTNDRNIIPSVQQLPLPHFLKRKILFEDEIKVLKTDVYN